MFRATLCAIACLLATHFSLAAHKMSVESFSLDDKDITANTEPTMRYDSNGDKCALIKIQTTERQFMFDVGSLGISHVEEQNAAHPAEIWLYVPHGVKTITIQHPVLGVINDYDLGRSVKKGKTYLLKLTADQVNTIVVDYENEQFLNVTVTPADATFIINGVKTQLTPEGTCEIPLSFGTHTYRATAKNYHPFDSTIVIHDKEKKQYLSVKLKQAFGYLTVNNKPEFDGAEVFIDGVRIGELPMKNFNVPSGNHTLRIHKPLYSAFNHSFTMTDSAFVSVTPTFDNNYAESELVVAADKDAEIYVDGTLLGTGSWKGRLEAGHHKAEVKKTSHRSSVAEFDVVKDNRFSLSLERPQPIFGTLKIETSPAGATVIIDGKEAGLTPYTNDRLLIGSHSVEVTKKGHKPEKSDVVIRENETESCSFKLTDICTATITLSPAWASLYIDDKYIGNKDREPYKLNLVAGEYKLKVTARGYTPWSSTRRLDGTTEDFNVSLHRDYVRRNEFYINAGYNVTGFSGVTAGMGGYYHKFNIEGTFIMGLTPSETIYWTDTNSEGYPCAVTYKPMGGTAKIGFGVRIGNRFRITPQIGCQIVCLNERQEGDSWGGGSYAVYSPVDKPMAVGGVFGARLSLAIAPCLGLSVSPQYAIGLMQSDGYKALSEISSKIKGYSEGFGCNVSLNLFF